MAMLLFELFLNKFNRNLFKIHLLEGFCYLQTTDAPYQSVGKGCKILLTRHFWILYIHLLYFLMLNWVCLSPTAKEGVKSRDAFGVFQ